MVSAPKRLPARWHRIVHFLLYHTETEQIETMATLLSDPELGRVRRTAAYVLRLEKQRRDLARDQDTPPPAR